MSEWTRIEWSPLPNIPLAERVLVATSVGEVFEAYCDKVGMLWWGNIEVDNATHWMPLPTPPSKDMSE